MQTLQSARLTSKPQLTLPMNTNYASSSNGSNPHANRPPPVRATGILRHRPAFLPVEDAHHLDSDPKTVELLTRFLVSQGIPLETSKDPCFLDLIKHLNRDCVLPAVNVMSKFLEKATSNQKPLVNYQKTVGPLTVTLDTEKQGDQAYLVFSIHYFEDLYERKNIVYLRKLHLGEINPDTLLTAARRAINAYSYQNVKFSNIVLPNEQIYHQIKNCSVVKRSFVCFYNYMSKFVQELLKVPELDSGLEELRRFVQYIRKDMDSYGKFRRMQLSKNAELDVPKLDKEGEWESTAIFLTRCLVLHDTFTEYCERFSLPPYISNTTFTHLVFFQRVLQQCIKYCKNLSQPDNSMSQVVPAVNDLRNFISNTNPEYHFHQGVMDLAYDCFKNITNGHSRSIYEVATFLDPRYGHRDLEKSVELEKKLIEDFVNVEPGLERSFFTDISLMPRAERISSLQKELLNYRKVIHVERPDESESPFIWWGVRQTDMEFLAVIAREYLATPATTVNARAYFSESGKFHYLCETYSYTQLENCLFTAGIHQKYTGRGHTVEAITPEQVDTLNSTERRIQKHVNYEMYAGPGCDGQDRNDIINAPYPPMPGMDMEMMEEVKEEPMIRAIPQAPPHQRMLQPGLRMQPKAAPMRQVRPLPPQGSRLIPQQVKLVRHMNILGQPEARRGSLEDRKTPKFPGASSGNQHNEEKPPELLPEQEIKEEQEDHQEEEEEDLDSSGPPKLTLASHQPAMRPIIRIPPKANTPMPQNIAHHNFVQPFAQKQKFIRKAPLPPAISIRAPMPGGNSKGVQYKRLAEPTLEEVKQEEMMETEEQEYEDYEEFERNLEQRRGAGFQRGGAGNYDAIRAVHNERIPGLSEARCYETHRNNEEALKRLPCNRRCQVCGHLTRHEALKNVTIDTEKLLLMLGCIYRGEFDLGAAKEFMDRTSKTYVCHVHFEETVDEIYSMLRLSAPDDIHCCSTELLHNTLITVTQIRKHISVPQLRKILYDFTLKNDHLRHNKSSLMDHYEPLPPPEPHDPGNNLEDEEEIAPKNKRQPRKQVLEADTAGGTVKVIAQEKFALPTAKPSDNEECENPGTCCFCSRVGARQGMHKIPRSEDRLARWIEKLGPEFEKRLNSEQENLICRSHFPEEAFSSRGRLLKGMIPEAIPEKLEVTFKIQGDQFKKVREQRTGPTLPRIGVPVEKQPATTSARKVGRPKGKVGRPRKTAVKVRQVSTDESDEEEPEEPEEFREISEESLEDVKQEIPDYEEYGEEEYVPEGLEVKEEDYDDYDYDPDQPSTSSALKIARRAIKRLTRDSEDSEDSTTTVRKSRRQAAKRDARSMSMTDDEMDDNPYASRAKIASNFMKQRHGKQ